MKNVPVSEYLELMLNEARDGVSFIDGMTRVEFLRNKMAQHAVSMSLTTIGELSGKIISDYPEFASDDFKIPLKSMRGMRNRIAHGYFGLDFEIVWETALLSLPPLIESLSAAIQHYSADDAAEKVAQPALR